MKCDGGNATKKEHILISRVENWNNNSSSGLVTHLFTSGI